MADRGSPFQDVIDTAHVIACFPGLRLFHESNTHGNQYCQASVLHTTNKIPHKSLVQGNMRQGKIHGFFRLRLSQQTPVTGFFPPGWLGYPLSAKAMVPRHQQRTVASPRPKRFSWTVAPVEGMMSENL